MVVEHEVPVLVAGGGPAGLIAALQLARHGVKCMLAERNLDTTKWPKMDITNCRSMELFNRLDIAQGLREQGVTQDYSFDVLISTGLSPGGELITKWDLPSPNHWRQRMREQNDGSMPREPYQRCSQAIFEAWLKPRIQAEPLIDSRFGLKYISLTETETGVETHLVDVQTGEEHLVRSQYVIGCDGAGSRVRKALGIDMIGGPVPAAMLLVHFKSRDLTALQQQGQFWHIFFSHGGVIISQDEIDTWTVHQPIGLDTDWEAMDAEETIRNALGGSIGPFPLKIDQVLLKSAWRPNICVAERYTSPGGRVFLSGDAAHQNIPTGGYGMNSAVGDSFDLGWKLASVIKGYGGRFLLDSYETERKPVAVRNIERSGVHHSVHQEYVGWVREAGHGAVTAQDAAGRALRQRIADHVLSHDGENQDHGIEMGYRNEQSPVVISEPNTSAPEWNYRNYIPSTWPGARAPHVFLADSETSIFDLFGPEYTLVDFSPDGKWAGRFSEVAGRLTIPLKTVHLPDEPHVAGIWERQAVLIRPDDHVAWRAPANLDTPVDVERMLNIAVGKLSSASEASITDDVLVKVRKDGFSGTIGNVNRDEVKLLAAFQK